MALDRQKILYELGSVINQLKSTDCGCMGKLFGDSGQNVLQTGNTPTYGGYIQGCGHGHHHGCSNSMPNNTQNFHTSCMDRCNPPKLYADTYNYLNKNLMRPTINEVYNDLKSITPTNTIMNNPLAQQMGLSNQNNAIQPTRSDTPNQMEKQNVLGNFNTSNMAASSGFNSNIKMGQIGGMGPQIMNMLGENQPSNTNNMTQQTKQVSLPMTNQYNYNEYTNLSAQPQNTNQLSKQLKQQHIGNYQAIGNMNANSVSPLSNNQHHGKHTQGMEKFKEMFPTVMKNDLGFDPMEIAIQMNPANQKKVAVETIHKMMNSNNISSSSKTNDNSAVINGSIRNNHYTAQPNIIQGNVFPNDVLQSNALQQQSNQQMQLQQQPVANVSQSNIKSISLPSTNPYGAYSGQTNVNAYTVLSTAPLLNQQQIQPEMIKEPILPADTTKYDMIKQEHYDYNTLGQPIETLPAKIYQTPLPGLPQTLSPQVSTNPRNDFAKYSNVKSTISKTSLMGIKPIGKTPSRNQLQHIYNQYKGSQSFTHQNIRENFNKDVTRSDGRLNVPQVNSNAQQMPIENVSGDTAANNQLNNERVNKIGHIMEQVGDAPIVKQTNNGPEKLSPAVNRKSRNGLQDLVYTSYPTSAAWSFHGHGGAAPLRTGYRYRNKA